MSKGAKKTRDCNEREALTLSYGQKTRAVFVKARPVNGTVPVLYESPEEGIIEGNSELFVFDFNSLAELFQTSTPKIRRWVELKQFNPASLESIVFFYLQEMRRREAERRQLPQAARKRVEEREERQRRRRKQILLFLSRAQERKDLALEHLTDTIEKLKNEEKMLIRAQRTNQWKTGGRRPKRIRIDLVPDPNLIQDKDREAQEIEELRQKLARSERIMGRMREAEEREVALRRRLQWERSREAPLHPKTRTPKPGLQIDPQANPRTDPASLPDPVLPQEGQEERDGQRDSFTPSMDILVEGGGSKIGVPTDPVERKVSGSKLTAYLSEPFVVGEEFKPGSIPVTEAPYIPEPSRHRATAAFKKRQAPKPSDFGIGVPKKRGRPRKG